MKVLGVNEMGVKSRLKTVWLLRMYMIDRTDSVLKESRSETRTRSAGNLFQRTTDTGKMDTGNNRLMYEFVCMRESACYGCILQGAQNMTEAVWLLGRK